MPTEYTIGQLAKQIGVPASTLRYYERRGLLHPTERTNANYRIYGSASVERLFFIRAAQASGFTLDDVLTLLNFRDYATAPCEEVQQLIEARLQSVDEKMAELRRVNRVLKASLRLCNENNRKQACVVLDRLSTKKPRKSRKNNH